MKWTTKQSQAIGAPVSDILVTAAAGSGKTAIMAERILKRITAQNGTDADRMLIVTYTNAAASEIKERIMKKISDELEINENENLRRQLVLINNADICTIHSFCLDLIRNNFTKLDLDPNIKIGSENDINILKEKALNNVLEEYYVQKDEAFFSLVKCYTGKDDSKLCEMINRLYRFVKSIPDGTKWLFDSVSNLKAEDNPCFDILKEAAQDELKLLASRYKIKILRYIDTDLSFLPYKDKYLNEYQIIENASNSSLTYDALYDALHVKFPTIQARDASVDGKEYIRPYREQIKKSYAEIQKKLVPLTVQESQKCFDHVRPLAEKLCEIVLKYDMEFMRLKKEKGLIDFADFEHFALKILTNEDGTRSMFADEIMNRYDEIYIDEYQDCNNIQQKIFDLISGANKGKPNIFMVGDMKQSIYKFRDANPKMFKDKCASYPEYTEGEHKPYSKIALNANFRSSPDILNSVNTVFYQIMSEKAGELEYDETQALYAGSDIYDLPDAGKSFVDVCIIDKDTENSDDEDTAKDSLLEARYIAKRIKDFVTSNEKVYDKSNSKFRPVRYSDVVVLMRGLRANTPYFEQAFEEYSVPYYTDAGGGYFNTNEVDELLNILGAIDNPLDDISLVSMMHSGIFGFTDNELAKIRTAFPKGYFYNALKAYAQKYENEHAADADSLYNRVSGFLSTLDIMYEKSRILSTEEFLTELIEDIDYFEYLSTFSNYQMRKSNVKALIYKAKSFEGNNYRGIYNFINYIKSIKDKGDRTDSAKTLNENDNVVRIMSIHKSKGLEFPVVFLARCSAKFNDTDYIRTNILLDKDLGIGLDYVNYDRRISYPTVTKLACRQNIKAAALSEEMRVLYVAMTRAREKLIITGVKSNPKDYLMDIAELVHDQPYKIDSRVVNKAKSMLDWLVMASIRCESAIVDMDIYFSHYVEDSNSISVIVEKPVYPEAEFIDTSTAVVAESTENIDTHVLKKLEYQYEYSDMAAVARNVSVTELKRMALKNMEEQSDSVNLYHTSQLKEPVFAKQEKGISGAAYGTLLHYIMEKLDFKDTVSEDRIDRQISALLDGGYISEEEYDALNTEAIYAFFKTDLGMEMQKNADSLKKEFSFKYLLDAKEIYDNVSADDSIVVQGIIDAFYTDSNGDAVIVDYKTDKVLVSPEETAQKYAEQLKYYAIALSKTIGKKVSKKYIYLFDKGVTVEL